MCQSPCITNKCLKYPICKFKHELTCDELYEFIFSSFNNIESENSFPIWWTANIETIFPNIVNVSKEKE